MDFKNVVIQEAEKEASRMRSWYCVMSGHYKNEAEMAEMVRDLRERTTGRGYQWMVEADCGDLTFWIKVRKERR